MFELDSLKGLASVASDIIEGKTFKVGANVWYTDPDGEDHEAKVTAVSGKGYMITVRGGKEVRVSADELSEAADKGDMDKDGKDEPDDQEYLDNKDKAIKKAMQNEVLDPKSDVGVWIKDFQNSDDPKFAGKSKEKRREMAIAAWYGARREAGIKEDIEEATQYVVEGFKKKVAAQAYIQNPNLKTTNELTDVITNIVKKTAPALLKQLSPELFEAIMDLYKMIQKITEDMGSDYVDDDAINSIVADIKPAMSRRDFVDFHNANTDVDGKTDDGEDIEDEDMPMAGDTDEFEEATVKLTYSAQKLLKDLYGNMSKPTDKLEVDSKEFDSMQELEDEGLIDIVNSKIQVAYVTITKSGIAYAKTNLKEENDAADSAVKKANLAAKHAEEIKNLKNRQDKEKEDLGKHIDAASQNK